jgi:hypothetical protein
MRRRARGVSVLAAWAVAAALLPAGPRRAAAQEQLNPEQLKKAYDDALIQLKAAQERKNQLAAENEKLTAQLAETNKQMAKLKGDVEEMRRTDAEHAEKMYFLRAHYAAWREFVRSDPALMGKWRAFFDGGILLAPHDLPEGLPPDWPMKIDASGMDF